MPPKFLVDYNERHELEIYTVDEAMLRHPVNIFQNHNITSKRRAIITALEKLTRENCIIKIGETDIIIKNIDTHESVTLKNAEKLLGQPDFFVVYNNIKKLIKEKGYVNLKNTYGLGEVRKRPQVPAIVKYAGAAVACGLLMVGSLSVFASNGQIVAEADDSIEYSVADTTQDAKKEDNIIEPNYLNTEKVSYTESNPNVTASPVQYEEETLAPVETEASVSYSPSIVAPEETETPEISEPVVSTPPEEAVTPVVTQPTRNSSEPVVLNLDFRDSSTTQKANTGRNENGDLIAKTAAAFGLDANLVTGQFTQESGGIHDPNVNAGGAIGISQIQYAVWVGHDINLPYYELNPTTGQFEKHVITYISDDMVKDLETNLRLGCIILQYYLIQANYNLTAALQLYNMGPGNVNAIIDAYCAETGKTRSQILNDPTDIGWLAHRGEQYRGPDRGYVEKVNEWVDVNTFTNINVLTGEAITTTYTNANEEALHAGR